MIVVQSLCPKALKLVTPSLKNLGTQLQKPFEQIRTQCQHCARPFLCKANSSQVALVLEIHWARWDFLKGALQSEIP